MPNDVEATNALDLLRSQHEEVDMLIAAIEKSDDSSEKADLFAELADKIAAHAAVEEQLFYPSMMAEETRDLLLEATEEHLVVKRELADMLDLDVDDERFDAKLTVLKEAFRHHAHDEEEDVLFPLVMKIASKDELEALGGEMLSMFETLLESHPRTHVSQETAVAAPL